MRLPIFAHYTYMLFKQIDHFFVRAQFSSTKLLRKLMTFKAINFQNKKKNKKRQKMST